MSNIKIRHIISTTGTNILTGIASLLLTIIVAHLLSTTENGRYSEYILVFNLYFLFFNLGIGPTTTYYLSSGLYKKDDLVSLIINLSMLIIIISILFCLSIVIFHLDSFFYKHFNIGIVIMMFGIITGFLNIIYNSGLALLLGELKYNIVNSINITKAIIPLCLTLFSSIWYKTSESLIITYTFSMLIVTMICIIISWKTVKITKSSYILRFNIKNTVSVFRYGLNVYASNIFHYSSMRGLILIISYHYSTDYVGYFSIALTLLEAILILPNSIGQIILPHSSKESLENGNTHVLLRLNLIVCGVISLIIIIFGKGIILFLFSEKYIEIVMVINMMIPSIILLSIPKILSQYLSGRGRPEYPLIASLISFILSIGSGLYLIPHYGVVGGAIAIDIVSLVTALVMIIGYRQVRGIGYIEILAPKMTDFIIFNKFK